MNQIVPVPVQIEIPPFDSLESVEIDPVELESHHVVGFSSRDIRSRPFNLLRSQLSKRIAARGARLIGLTSATPAAGKSFISLNLSAALSRLPDRSVYLFDFDLRRGSLAEAFGLQADYGLADFLVGRTDSLASFGRRIGESNLALFPCYPEPGINSAELLVGKRFDDLIAAMRRLPEDAIVLCDLPPAFANDDTIMVTEKLDAYLMIVDQGVTTKKQVEGTVELLQPTPCLGTILNRFSGTFSDPYGYGYSYGRNAYSQYYGS